MAKAATAIGTSAGQCLCGKVCFEIDVPARWAWHDHSAASRRAHGAAYATYVGSWRKRFRITKGKAAITRTGEPLVPLKGFPGVVWQRSKRKKRIDHDGMF